MTIDIILPEDSHRLTQLWCGYLALRLLFKVIIDRLKQGLDIFVTALSRLALLWINEAILERAAFLRLLQFGIFSYSLEIAVLLEIQLLGVADGG